MKSQTFHTTTEEQTIALGVELAKHLPPAATVLLVGNLGAGKTTIAKGFAQTLAALAPDEVSSPTFTLIHEYSPRLIHIDLYRIEDEKDFDTLGLDDILESDAVVLIEWGERFLSRMPSKRIEIRIEAPSENERHFQVTGL